MKAYIRRSNAQKCPHFQKENSFQIHTYSYIHIRTPTYIQGDSKAKGKKNKKEEEKIVFCCTQIKRRTIEICTRSINKAKMKRENKRKILLKICGT